ncbi:hypothetical protein M2366_003610 [Aeromonas sp. BIGb0405]|uniref:tetratricopeptide repeat protein n=1 Tax=Aeromonas sp. BIGb0405 TaxID=2940592 RepID=UPI002166FA68|nr:hypothetical protein [Aeromonas sp. BIGb0405]MCS3457495.1 hypothetical protein [Aeromonas sp. BIGb0405]
MITVKATKSNTLLYFMMLLITPQFALSNTLMPIASDARTYAIDIDNNGVAEKIITEENGEKLYITNNAGEVILTGSNLTVDGYSVLDEIIKPPNNEKGFIIINKGSNFGAYIKNTISIYNNELFLTKVTATSENNIDGVLYNKINCSLNLHVLFRNISSDDVQQTLLSPDDENFPDQCNKEELSYFKFTELEALTKSGKISWTIQSADYFLKNNPINKGNVTAYNNIAYYILKFSPDNPASLYFLNEILSKYPERAVANLNAADYLWANSKCSEAKELYKKYIQLMKRDGKEKMIPTKVFDFQSMGTCE